MAVVFLISSMAETFRTPFDLTEAESELVAGFPDRIFVDELRALLARRIWQRHPDVRAQCHLFWGGWLPPLNIDLIPWFDIPGILWLFAKMRFFFFVFSWVRATVPRYRYDQLMRLGWKIFLPLSLVFVFLISGYLMLTRYGAGA
jgi:NADH-quinone oxidoreductase subunit H